MNTILMTPDGKKVVITPEKDVRLYNAPHNPPNTGTSYTAGIDLYAHKARSGTVYFYTYHWSMWQGTESYYNLVTESQARDFILGKASATCLVADGIYDSAAEEYFPGLFKENA